MQISAQSMQTYAAKMQKYQEICTKNALNVQLYAQDAHKICHYIEFNCFEFQHWHAKYADYMHKICRHMQQILKNMHNYAQNIHQIPKYSKKIEHAQNLPIHRLQHAYSGYAKYAECIQ